MMQLLYPAFLAFIPVSLWLLHRRRKRSSITVASVQALPSAQAGRARFLWLPPFLRNICVALLFIALARPQAGTSFDANISEGIAIQLLVDVSSSMDMSARGFDGEMTTRMEIAKTMVERFIAGDGETLQGRSQDLIGLISFARYADTRSPLTFGHDALLQIVRNLEIQERPNEDGTAYGDALAIAAARLKNIETYSPGFDAQDIKSRVIILLTDGENNSGKHLPTEAAGLAKAWDCRIYVVSLGGEAYLGDGERPFSELSDAEKTLEHIAEETGGIFRQAYDLESLLSVYAEIDELERSEISTRTFERTAELFWLPLALGIFCLFTAMILEATWLRVVP